MNLTAFRIGPRAPRIRAARASREWMDGTGERFAYRCLPLTIANAHGWEILCPHGLEAYWNGGAGLNDVRVMEPGGTTAASSDFAASHFGHGILTLHTGYLFRTDPGFSLYVTGPVNHPKDGAAALTGVVETDWLPQPFTMNWMFTAEGGPIVFEEGEPFCHVFPVPRALIEEVEPEVRELAAEPALRARYEQWASSREAFNRDLRVPGSAAAEEKWQKHYARGRHPDGTTGSVAHRTKLRVREFREADESR